MQDVEVEMRDSETRGQVIAKRVKVAKVLFGSNLVVEEKFELKLG